MAATIPTERTKSRRSRLLVGHRGSSHARVIRETAVAAPEEVQLSASSSTSIPASLIRSILYRHIDQPGTIATADLRGHPAFVPDLVERLHHRRPVAVALKQPHVESGPAALLVEFPAAVFLDVDLHDPRPEDPDPLLRPAVRHQIPHIQIPADPRALEGVHELRGFAWDSAGSCSRRSRRAMSIPCGFRVRNDLQELGPAALPGLVVRTSPSERPQAPRGPRSRHTPSHRGSPRGSPPRTFARTAGSGVVQRDSPSAHCTPRRAPEARTPSRPPRPRRPSMNSDSASSTPSKPEFLQQPELRLERRAVLDHLDLHGLLHGSLRRILSVTTRRRSPAGSPEGRTPAWSDRRPPAEACTRIISDSKRDRRDRDIRELDSPRRLS